MEPRGRLRPEVTQLWCWGPDGATTTEERLTIDDAAAVRDALRKEAGGDRAPYPAWVSTAWHVLRWDEPSARVSWELVSLALHQSASVDAPLPCAALAAFVGTRAALAPQRPALWVVGQALRERESRSETDRYLNVLLRLPRRQRQDAWQRRSSQSHEVSDLLLRQSISKGSAMESAQTQKL